MVFNEQVLTATRQLEQWEKKQTTFSYLKHAKKKIEKKKDVEHK